MEKKSLLTDQEVWEVLFRAGQAIGEKRGATDLGDGSISAIRTMLVACQMSLLSKIEGDETQRQDDLPKMRNLTIRMLPEINQSLTKYAKDHHMLFGAAEAAAFAIGYFLAEKGYYQPRPNLRF